MATAQLLGQPLGRSHLVSQSSGPALSHGVHQACKGLLGTHTKAGLSHWGAGVPPDAGMYSVCSVHRHLLPCGNCEVLPRIELTEPQHTCPWSLAIYSNLEQC